MRNEHKAKWLLVFMVVALVQAMALFTPRVTHTSDTNQVSLPPEPTIQSSDGGARRHKTFFGPASDCGYWGDIGTYRCDDNYPCRFHASNAAYPAMMGCCPNSPAGPCGGFYSVCYGRHQISQAPSLASFTDDIFAIFCTKDDYPHCLPWTWPEIGVSAFECTNFTLKGTATLYTAATYTNDLDVGVTMVSTVSISWMEDDELIRRLNLKPGSRPDVSFALVGAVIGAVAGGAAAISAAVLVLWMLRKKKRSNRRVPLNSEPVLRGVSSPLATRQQTFRLAERKPSELGGLGAPYLHSGPDTHDNGQYV
ncbi:hypothetical protein ETB97_007132 [Aspergillus alliaceus]|uniref:Transmembrane protein n=1 Tax=Petromyces alliaceus TaxID=209559 RepID=A0A8H6E357_PETAA|nr:hypothetical protein ETB97_007132 [Aspergillus burnettii]